MTAHIFYFSLESLADVNIAASAFSTNGDLNTLVWRHMTIACSPTSLSGGSLDGRVSRILYEANIRSRTNLLLPVNYLGNATDYLKVSALLGSSGLVTASETIRKSVTALHSPDRAALTIGLLNTRADPSDLKFAYNGFLGSDISTTSWADVGIYRSDWGPIMGQVDAFRVPGGGTDGGS
jgi:hypothetical protein